MIRFTIRGQCVSMKNSRAIVKFGDKPALIKSPEAREYERAALLQIPADARQMLEGPVRATIRLWYASERPDLDASLLLDILAARYEKRKGKLVKTAPGEYSFAPSERILVQRGVYANDRQVRELHLYHAVDRANPRAEIEIEPMAEQIALPIVEQEKETVGNPF